jgi:hypothetical protein
MNLQKLKEDILKANAYQKWVLPNPVTVRLSDADFDVLEIQGVQVNEKLELFVMVFSDGHGYDVEQWCRLEDLCNNTELVIDKLYEYVQRINGFHKPLIYISLGELLQRRTSL